MATAAAAAVPAAISTVTTAGTAPPVAQPLEQLGKTIPPAAARKSAPPALTTISGKRSGSPAARNVSVLRREETFPHILRDNYARTNATFIYGTIFRSPCRAVRYRSPCRAVQHWNPCRAIRHSPPSSLDITRPQWSIDPFRLRASVKSSQFCTCPADATAAQICRASTSAGASFGFRLELLHPRLYRHNMCLQASFRVWI